MNYSTNEFTLLSKEQVFGSQEIDVIKNIGTKCAISDFAILLGAYVSSDYHVDEDSSSRGRTGWWYLSSSAGDGDVQNVSRAGTRGWTTAGKRSGAVRPVLSFSNISDISPNGVRGRSGFLEVEYGEYPQYVVDTSLGRTLDSEFSAGRLRKTGKTYTTDSRRWNARSEKFNPVEHEEFEYKGKKYVRVKSNCGVKGYKLSNGDIAHHGNYFWLEVSPITWLVDEKSRLILSKICLASGIRFCNDGQYDGDFENTEMYMFLNDYFAKDMMPSTTYEIIEDDLEKKNRETNPYGLKFGQVNEEEIIRGMVEADIPVFLHGLSGDGKSSRVKQIDSESEEVHLGSITMDMLIGKSYVDTDGETKQAMPDWLRSLLRKCEEEPDRIHILFLDELTNTLPSIQARVFNLVLEKKLEYFGKLPDNVRIVAAGNEMQDSLAANPLAEPLFGRFAHVYIKTTAETWLKWARENNIHPSIYAFISYKGDAALRSEYNGEKPNADPRSWEMASKMVYATGSPEMLRALIGEDLTREFVAFCRQRVITVEDVINGDYREEEIQELNTAQRYATVVEISKVDEENIEVVREFAKSLGGEYRALFDNIWTKDSDERLEIIAEIKLAEKTGKTR